MLRGISGFKEIKESDNSTIGSICPPISISNFLLAGSSKISMPTKPTDKGLPTKSGCVGPIVVHGLLDIAVDRMAAVTGKQ